MIIWKITASSLVGVGLVLSVSAVANRMHAFLSSQWGRRAWRVSVYIGASLLSLMCAVGITVAIARPILEWIYQVRTQGVRPTEIAFPLVIAAVPLNIAMHILIMRWKIFGAFTLFVRESWSMGLAGAILVGVAFLVLHSQRTGQDVFLRVALTVYTVPIAQATLNLLARGIARLAQTNLIARKDVPFYLSLVCLCAASGIQIWVLSK